MGHLIPTGVSDQGHSITFDYIGEGDEQKCFMRCVCDWSIEIESFRHPWSITESRVRFQRHMEDLGLRPREQ